MTPLPRSPRLESLRVQPPRGMDLMGHHEQPSLELAGGFPRQPKGDASPARGVLQIKNPDPVHPFQHPAPQRRKPCLLPRPPPFDDPENCRPETAINVGPLAGDQTQAEDVGASSDMPQYRVHRAALRVSPPGPNRGPAGDEGEDAGEVLVGGKEKPGVSQSNTDSAQIGRDRVWRPRARARGRATARRMATPTRSAGHRYPTSASRRPRGRHALLPRAPSQPAHPPLAKSRSCIASLGPAPSPSSLKKT